MKISLRVTEDMYDFLKLKGNRSKYIRELIKRNMKQEEVEFSIEEVVRRVVREMGVVEGAMEIESVSSGVNDVGLFDVVERLFEL